MTNIQFIKNKKTEQVFIANYDQQTIFHKYNENDFLHIGMLLWYINKKDDENDDNIMDIDINDENKTLFNDETIKNKPKLQLSDFPELYTKLIKKWNDNVLKKLKTYLDATSEQNDDLLYMYDIRPNGIGIEKTIQELSELYKKSDIDKNRNKSHFHLWRNKIIINTVRNFKYNKINAEFLTFIILNIFKQFENKFYITDYKQIYDGKNKKRKISRKRSKRKISRKRNKRKISHKRRKISRN
jgi:hypothetical protein